MRRRPPLSAYVRDASNTKSTKARRSSRTYEPKRFSAQRICLFNIRKPNSAIVPKSASTKCWINRLFAHKSSLTARGEFAEGRQPRADHSTLGDKAGLIREVRIDVRVADDPPRTAPLVSPTKLSDC